MSIHRRARRSVALLPVALLLAACGAASTGSEAPAARPVIIDTDLDVSDVAAVALLVLDPGLDVRAITVTPAGTGVTSCASGRAVIGYVLEELGRSDIPYACGGADAGGDALPFPAEWRSAADTGWGIAMAPQPQTETPESAIDLLLRAVDAAPRPPTVVALGPWTNLEHALAAEPSLAERVAGIHAMAASVDAPGNVLVEGLGPDDRLEWNVVADPSAFRAVFGTEIPLTLVPLDATDDVPVRPAVIEALAEAGGGGANLVYELFVRVPGRIGEGQQLWDELAALALLKPELASWEDLTLGSDRDGRLERTADGRAVRVAMAADASATEAALVAALDRGEARRTPFALGGEIAGEWDGTTCTAEPDAPLTSGVAGLTFTNGSDAPGGISILGVTDPHTWAEVKELVATIDPETTEEPDWITFAASLGDETGASEPMHGTVSLEPGVYGPVCISGTWPDVVFVAGDPFEVVAP